MNNSQDEKREQEEAGAKTAHVALKGGAEVVAPGIGGRVYDAASKVPGVNKVVKGAEKVAGQAIAKTPVVGSLNKKLNNGLNNNGRNSQNGQRANNSNANSPSNPNTNNNAPSSQSSTPAGRNQSGGMKRPSGNRPFQPRKNTNETPNLNKNNLSNNQNANSDNSNTSSGGGSLLPKALQRRKENLGFLNSFHQRNQSVSETSEDTTDDTSSSVADTVENTKKTFAAIIKLSPFLLPIILIVAFLLIIVIGVAYPGSSLASSLSLKSHTEEEKDYVYDEVQDSKDYDNEIKYNDAIRGDAGIVQEYQSKYGVTIDWLLLHNVLKYRYTLTSENDLYTDNGNSDISEEELNKNLENLETEDGSTSSDSSFDYGAASKKIKAVAALMVTKDADGNYSTDTKVGGSFYNALIDSEFLKGYYKDFLTDDSYDARKALVDEIFEQYEFEKEALTDENGSGFLADGMQMYLQTCEYPPYSTTTNERGKTVFSNNRNINKGTNYPEYFSLTDYLKGAVEGELGRSSLTAANREGVKAFVVATLTYMLGSFYVDFYPGVQTINFPSGDCRLVSCDVVNGCTYTYNGNKYGTAYSGTNRYGSGGIHRPWNETQNAYMDSVLSEIFGVVMVYKGVTTETFRGGEDLRGGSYYDKKSNPNCGNNCMGQEDALEDSRNGMTYDEILAKYYHGDKFDLINISEGLYVNAGNYTNSNYNGRIIFFDQSNYKVSFCGRNDATIYGAGCGVTATAIVIASMTGDQSKDPVWFSDMAKETGDCGYDVSGTSPGFFEKAAARFNLDYQEVSSKNNSKVLEALATGNSLVIAHMGSGHFTNGGHYIVLSGVREDGKVYVYDPNNHYSSSGGNGWWSFNDVIVPELRGSFHIFTKRG